MPPGRWPSNEVPVQDTRLDRVGGLLAALLAIAPVLPTGLTYAGLSPFAYVELVVPVLVLLWAAGRLEARGRAPHPWPLPHLVLAWHVLIAVLVGAALFGLMAENRLDSAVFRVRLREAAGDLFWPMNQALHPLYPLRVGLTFVEGWLVFLLVADLCRRGPDPRRRARTALTGWLTGFALAAGFALVQYVSRFDLHPYWVKANPGIVRAHSTLDDPNALGAYLVLGIGLLAGLLRLGDARRRLWWSALLAAGVAGLATTMSRAALGAALVAPLGVLAIGPRPLTPGQRTLRTTGRAMVAVLTVVVLGSAVFRASTTEQRRTQPDNHVQLVVKTFDPRESADWVLRGRLAWWGAAAAMFREQPATGVGLGRFPRLLEAYGGGRTQENTHNLFLQLLAESGLPGGLAFTVLCATLCVAFGRMVRTSTDSRNRAMALGGLIGNLAFLMTLLTGHWLLVPSGQILWAGFVAAVAGIAGASGVQVGSRGSRAAPGSRGLPTGTGGARRRALTAAGVVSLALCYPVAAFVQGVGPRSDDWGYSWGLYPEEHTSDGIAYRWTSGRALLDLTIAPGATTLEMPVAAPSPMREGAPTILRVTAGGAMREITLATAAVQTIAIPLPEVKGRTSGRMLVEIVVAPTFIPSRSLPAADDRVLGAQLLRPRFVHDAGHDTPE